MPSHLPSRRSALSRLSSAYLASSPILTHPSPSLSVLSPDFPFSSWEGLRSSVQATSRFHPQEGKGNESRFEVPTAPPPPSFYPSSLPLNPPQFSAYAPSYYSGMRGGGGVGFPSQIRPSYLTLEPGTSYFHLSKRTIDVSAHGARSLFLSSALSCPFSADLPLHPHLQTTTLTGNNLSLDLPTPLLLHHQATPPPSRTLHRPSASLPSPQPERPTPSSIL